MRAQDARHAHAGAASGADAGRPECARNLDARSACRPEGFAPHFGLPAGVCKAGPSLHCLRQAAPQPSRAPSGGWQVKACAGCGPHGRQGYSVSTTHHAPAPWRVRRRGSVRPPGCQNGNKLLGWQGLQGGGDPPMGGVRGRAAPQASYQHPTAPRRPSRAAARARQRPRVRLRRARIPPRLVPGGSKGAAAAAPAAAPSRFHAVAKHSRRALRYSARQACTTGDAGLALARFLAGKRIFCIFCAFYCNFSTVCR